MQDAAVKIPINNSNMLNRYSVAGGSQCKMGGGCVGFRGWGEGERRQHPLIQYFEIFCFLKGHENSFAY
jgi:hypothetical protein